MHKVESNLKFKNKILIKLLNKQEHYLHERQQLLSIQLSYM